jgi:hypothetical protein
MRDTTPDTAVTLVLSPWDWWTAADVSEVLAASDSERSDIFCTREKFNVLFVKFVCYDTDMPVCLSVCLSPDILLASCFYSASFGNIAVTTRFCQTSHLNPVVVTSLSLRWDPVFCLRTTHHELTVHKSAAATLATNWRVQQNAAAARVDGAKWLGKQLHKT